jgi:hypothetical protein
MQRKRIHKRPKLQRERTRIETLPLEPRDPDVIRAKQILQSSQVR